MIECPRKCPVCGKMFITPYPEVWAYKFVEHKPYKSVWLCSWGCLRKEEAIYEDIKAQRHAEWVKGMKERWKKRKEKHADTATSRA